MPLSVSGPLKEDFRDKEDVDVKGALKNDPAKNLQTESLWNI